MSQTQDQRVEDLVAECLMQREAGATSIPYAEICREAPHLEDEVRRSVELAVGFPTLQKAGPGADKLVGSLLSERYRVAERIGSGAMGVVYGADDLELSRRVAIKVVHTGLLDRGKALARFEREAAALAAIRHESVVNIYDRGVTGDGYPFLVMERIDGIPCSDLLEAAKERGADDDSTWLTEEFGIENVSEPSYFRQAVQWAASLASGLEAAHAAGVYHRDVKPSNVMITRQGKAILLDFGIAAKDDHATLTQTDAAVGTLVYMAPEALLGRTKAKPTQDVYSLAATLYHFLTFQAPYQGSSAEILTALATREPVPAFKVRPGLPRDAQAILDHGLARNPSQRYQSAEAMESDLRAMLAHRPVKVRPTSSIVRVARRFRSSKAFLGAAAATLVIAGALGVQAWRGVLAERRALASDGAIPHVIANLGVVKPRNRFIADEAVRAESLQALDRLVDAAHDPVSERTLRAAFLHDHGRTREAIADMEVACAAAGTSYASELLKRFRGLAVDSSSARDLDLSEMPSIESADDRYLGAYMGLRAGKVKVAEALALLEDEQLAPRRHAQELKLALRTVPFEGLKKAYKFDELYEQTEALIDDTRALELRTGVRSAATCHLISTALLRQGYHAEALAIAKEGLELAPGSHVILGNAGICALELGGFDEAARLLTRGLALSPGYLSFMQDLAKVRARQGDAEEARRLVAEIAFPDSLTGQRQRAALLGLIELWLAKNYVDSDPDEAASCALRALAQIEVLAEDSPSRRMISGYAAGLLGGTKSLMLSAVLTELAHEPHSIALFEEVAPLIDGPISEDQALLLKRWFELRADQRDRNSRLAPGR